VVVAAVASSVPEIFPAFEPEFVNVRPLGSNELETAGHVIGPVPAAVRVNEYD
jgi:hypothetical protein